jgi:hypothetical protein
MTRSFSTAFWLAWSLWAATLALMALTVVFTALYPLSRDPASNAVNFGIAILFVAAFQTVGALIASRRPENPIGWVFCGMGLALVAAVFFGNYAQYSLVVEPGALPWAEEAAWVGNWIWLVALSPLGFFLLLFPDGHPPSPRWWPVAWVQGTALVGWFVSQAFAPGPMINAGYESVDNPYGIEALGGVFRGVGAVSGLLLLATVLASILSIIVRFRRSRGDERRQIEWVAYAAALVALVLLVQLAAEAALPETDALVEILNLSLAIALTGVPIAAGVAILKYRLYEIDAIIYRTLVYGALTILLVAIYFGGVVLSQYAFRGLTGQGSDLAVVVSTLAIAALFNPLRRRIQALVDRRFYRRKYDAAKTLQDFGARLRDEVELRVLQDDLISVVEETLQPAHVSLWIRPPSETGEETAR